MSDPERYVKACHAMQSGVAMEMETGGMRGTEAKHLRVGVNSAMVEHAALVKLLMRRGMITEAEYWKALADQMEEEARSYEKWISERLGTNIRLG
jgi:hypothetical protein